MAVPLTLDSLSEHVPFAPDAAAVAATAHAAAAVAAPAAAGVGVETAHAESEAAEEEVSEEVGLLPPIARVPTAHPAAFPRVRQSFAVVTPTPRHRSSFR